MKIESVKKWAMAALVVFLAAAAFWITVKLLKSSAKVEEKVIKVSGIRAELKDINETVVIQGIAEGDPQIKIYPAVPGKFERVAAREGSAVKKDDTILFINRDIVGMDFQLAPIKSSVNGIVTKIYYSDKGAAVSPQNPVAEVADPDNVKVILHTGEEEMVKVKSGMDAEIKPVYGDGAPVKVSVYSCTPFIDTDTMSGTIIVKGGNPGRVIKPGMSVEVTIHTTVRKSIMIPQSALLMGEGKTYVYVNDNGRAKSTDVEPGYMSGDDVEIKSGITEGADVITDGNFKLSDGARISEEK
jgi:multidrug efflux pump subunit AcrA (membrane-fusion protein)